MKALKPSQVRSVGWEAIPGFVADAKHGGAEIPAANRLPVEDGHRNGGPSQRVAMFRPTSVIMSLQIVNGAIRGSQPRIAVFVEAIG